LKPRRPVFDPLAQKYKRNEAIIASEVRLVDTDGEPLGIVPLAEALKKAQEAELDLVEVAPTAKPPVCKITSWSKFKYDQSKKNKGSATKSKIKEIRMGALIGDHDRLQKSKRIKEFLNDKHMVKVTVRTPSRIRRERSADVMNKVIDDVYEYGEVDGGVKMEGAQVIVTVKPLKVKRQRPEVEDTTLTA